MKITFKPNPKPEPKPKKAKQPLKRTKIKPRSKKREAENKVYLMLREKFLRDNPNCAVFPNLLSTEVHHKYSGKDRAKYFLVVDTWLAVSRKGHNSIHDNPEISRVLGFLK